MDTILTCYQPADTTFSSAVSQSLGMVYQQAVFLRDMGEGDVMLQWSQHQPVMMLT